MLEPCRLGFEFKRTAAPAMTRSMATALKDLRLERLDVVYPGEETYPLEPGVRALGMGRLLEDLKPLEEVHSPLGGAA